MSMVVKPPIHATGEGMGGRASPNQWQSLTNQSHHHQDPLMNDGSTLYLAGRSPMGSKAPRSLLHLPFNPNFRTPYDAAPQPDQYGSVDYQTTPIRALPNGSRGLGGPMMANSWSGPSADPHMQQYGGEPVMMDYHQPAALPMAAESGAPRPHFLTPYGKSQQGGQGQGPPPTLYYSSPPQGMEGARLNALNTSGKQAYLWNEDATLDSRTGKGRAASVIGYRQGMTEWQFGVEECVHQSSWIQVGIGTSTAESFSVRSASNFKRVEVPEGSSWMTDRLRLRIGARYRVRMVLDLPSAQGGERDGWESSCHVSVERWLDHLSDAPELLLEAHLMGLPGGLVYHPLVQVDRAVVTVAHREMEVEASPQAPPPITQNSLGRGPAYDPRYEELEAQLRKEREWRVRKDGEGAAATEFTRRFRSRAQHYPRDGTEALAEHCAAMDQMGYFLSQAHPQLAEQFQNTWEHLLPYIFVKAPQGHGDEVPDPNNPNLRRYASTTIREEHGGCRTTTMKLLDEIERLRARDASRSNAETVQRDQQGWERSVRQLEDSEAPERRSIEDWEERERRGLAADLQTALRDGDRVRLAEQARERQEMESKELGHRRDVQDQEEEGRGRLRREEAEQMREMRKELHSHLRPTLGVEIMMLDDASTGGKDCLVVVHNVIEEPPNPAHLAGIKDGDILHEWDGDLLDSKAKFAEKVKNSVIGDEVLITVMRKGGDGDMEDLPKRVTIQGTEKKKGGPRTVNAANSMRTE